MMVSLDPGTFDPARMGDASKSRVYFLILVACTTLIFLTSIGRRDLWTPDEPRVAGIMAEMALDGNLVVPMLNHKPFLEKPPLYFWFGAAILNFMGETAFTARLPSALAAILGVFAVFLLARSMGFSPFTALLSGFVLTTSAEYWQLGRVCLIDMLLCCFITLAMAAFFHAGHGGARSRWWYIVFVGFLSCAVLTKGLVGLAIPLSALGMWLLISGRLSIRSVSALFAASVLCLIPAGIWVLFLYNKLGWEGVYEAVWVNNFCRFSGSRASHVQPFYYYLTSFPLQFLPWTLFIPFAAIHLFRKVRRAGRDKASLFILAWMAAPFILLSLSAGKRGLYMLPLYPAAALWVGSALGPVLECGKESGKEGGKPFLIPLGMLAGITLLIGVAFCGMGIYFDQSILLCLVMSVPCFALGIWAVRRFIRKEATSAFKAVGLALIVFFITVGYGIYPLFNPIKSFSPIFDECKQLLAEGYEIGLHNSRESVSGGAVFYLNRHFPELHDEEELRRFLGTGEKTIALSEEKVLPESPGIRIVKSFIVGKRAYVFFDERGPKVAGSPERSATHDAVDG
ncbi:MAG: glycosyltransferase family 39 protein [Planctomycetota bacterium]